MKIKKLLISGFIGVMMLFQANQSIAQCPNIWPYENEHIEGAFDTVVNVANPTVNLKINYFFTPSMPTTQYAVEAIPYNPPEPFTLGTPLNVTADDAWDNDGGLTILFPFQFFGKTRTKVTCCGNGVVTFANVSAGDGTQWQWDPGANNQGTNHYLPITTPSTFPYKNSILALTNDYNPASIPSSDFGTNGQKRGIFKYQGGEYPCRHITFSWHKMPLWGRDASNPMYNSTFQVVFYEGTNIIEIHIKEHHSLGGPGLYQRTCIGILDSTGRMAYTAPGRNPFTTTIDSAHAEAWRFTPVGKPTRVSLTWWKYSEDMQDSTKIMRLAEYGGNIPDAYLPDCMGQSNDDTICVATPTRPTTYRCWTKYIGVTPGLFYTLSAEFFVDRDTANITHVTSPDTRICNGSTATITLEYPRTGERPQRLDKATWECFRVVNGQHTPVAANRCTFNADSTQMILAPLPEADIIPNHIDSTYIVVQALYTNGATNHDSIYIQSFPNFNNDTLVTGKCQGESFVWAANGQTYTTTTFDSVMLESSAHCDSLVFLDFTVSDVSYTTDYQKHCTSYLWPVDSNTYTESTNVPKVTLKNRWNCDSTVNLNLEITPVVAAINASPEGVTLDDLNVRLTDISTGNSSRTWMFPDGTTSNSYIHNYTYPSDQDSVKIGLVARSNVDDGCPDTAYVTIPLLREAIWVPNIFCPSAEAPNNVFKPMGIGITYLEVYIYDRSGRQVAHIDGINDAWDGTTDNGLKCPQGAYVYRMRYKNVLAPESMQIKTGTVTLIR